MADTTLSLVHPGEILLEEFVKPMGITRHRLAKVSMFPKGLLMKYALANVASLLIQPYD